MFNSLKKGFLGLTFLFIVLLGLAFFVIAYDIRQNLGFGVSVDYAGRLRFNSQLYAKLASYYYESHCLKGEAPLSEEEVKKQIDTAKNDVARAISVLKEGKEGVSQYQAYHLRLSLCLTRSKLITKKLLVSLKECTPATQRL